MAENNAPKDSENRTKEQETYRTKVEAYSPKICDEGSIPFRFLDTTTDQLPSFCYAFPESMLHDSQTAKDIAVSALHHKSRIFDGTALFVRQNRGEQNLLYNSGPCVFRYRDTYSRWLWDLEYVWLLNSKGEQRDDEQEQVPGLNIDGQDAHSDENQDVRRLIIIEGLENEAISSNPDLGLEDHKSSGVSFDQTFWRTGDFRYQMLYLRFCWYSVDDNSLSQKWRASWPHGPLYGSKKGEKLAGKALFIKFESPTKNQHHWTCSIRTPSHLMSMEDVESLLHEPLLAPPFMLLIAASSSLRGIIEDWNNLLSYMEELIKADTAILEPHEHDALLFDDDQFSRSRLYFWMLSSLNEFLPVMKRSRSLCSEVADFVRAMNPEKSRLPEHEDSALEAMTAQIDSFDNTIKRGWTLHHRVVAFRDGLFNASAVLESRAANRLSENVKLLTYVSIFYLPLAFCASLWSTTDTFSWNGLKIAMVLTAVATYLVTFNLNQIVRLTRSIYDVGKKRLVKSMAQSKDGAWTERAAEFNQFQPPRFRPQPSEWLLLWYVFEVGLIAILTSVSRVIRAVSPSLKTEHSAPTASGSGRNEGHKAIERIAPQDSAAGQIQPETMGTQETTNTQTTNPHAPDGEVPANISTTSSTSIQDVNANDNHTSVASGDPAIAFAAKPSAQSRTANIEATSPQASNLLRRHSRKEPDLEAGAGAADEREKDRGN